MIYCEEQVLEIDLLSDHLLFRMPATRRQKWKRYSGKWVKKWKRLKKERLKLMMSSKKCRYGKTCWELSVICSWSKWWYILLLCSLWWMKPNMLLGTSSLKLCLRSAPFACPQMWSETSWRECWDWWASLIPPGSAWRGQRGKDTHQKWDKFRETNQYSNQIMEKVTPHLICLIRNLN